jgi:heavy metal sensor kinase
VWLWSPSIRTRLTVLYTTMFASVLAIYIGCAAALLYWNLRDQLYHAEIQDSETVEGLLYFTPFGQLLLNEDYHSRSENRLLLNRLMQVMSTDGRVLFRNEKLNGCDLGGPPLQEEFSRSRFVARRIRTCDGSEVLTVSHVHLDHGHPLLIRVGYSLEPLQTRVAEFIGTLALSMPLAILAAAFAGYRVTTRALYPLEKMARVTERISANRLGERIPIDNPGDELGHMAGVLNGLLQRLENSFEGLRRFTSDVSHELRTPLASMRSVGEVGLQGRHDGGQYRETIGSMLEEVARLSSMVEMLLTIAHGDSGSLVLQRTWFRVSELMEEAVGIVSVLAEEKDQQILTEGDQTIELLADRAFLRMVLINLMENAVKYSPGASRVFVSWRAVPGNRWSGASVEMSVADEGPGIAEPERARVFERFYRVGEAASKAPNGTGLGLAIAKWVVESHGGQIVLEPSESGGSLFKVRLPVAADLDVPIAATVAGEAGCQAS